MHNGVDDVFFRGEAMDNDKPLKQAYPVMKRQKKALGRDNEPADLDVTPVMNLFMVLVPFLISMAVFTHIAVVEFSLPPSQASGAEGGSDNKELDISIVVTASGFRIVGTGKKLDLVPRMQGSYQYDQLRVLLKAIKFQYPSQKSVILVLESDVLYDDIIRFMDVCRESQFPDIGLSGEVG
jgi:biopolymer transport protein ExbD